MSNLSESIRSSLGVRPEIDPHTEIERRVQFLVEYCLTASAHGFVLGISGGQDSSLAGRLAQLAVEELRRRSYDASFHAVRLPYKEQADAEDARLALEFIRPDSESTFDIAGGVDGVTAEYLRVTGTEVSDFDKGNAKARMRMIAQYVYAGAHKALVIGTDHAAEALTGFYTKFGDGGADVLPLSGLTKRQGKALLQALDAPERLWLKTPTADLLDGTPGQPDEASLGVTYDQIDDYLEGRPVSEDVAMKLEMRYTLTGHKRALPVTPDDSWWIRH